MKLRLVTWDVKDTLLRMRLPVGQQYHSVAKKRGLHVDPASLEQSFRQAYRAHSRLFPNYGLTQGMTSQQWWSDVVGQTFRLSGVRDEGSIRLVTERLYGDFSTSGNWEVIPGAREALQGCRDLGLRLAVVSNFDRRLEEVLRQCNLHGHFEFVLTSERAGIAKPDPGIFRKALSLARVAACEAAHVGDDYVNDYRAARDVGMESYLLRPEGNPRLEEHRVPNEHLIRSPDELIQRLQNATE
ncbi:haloacid dehalogenase-like hydrolase domain-containing protein 3 [Spea bombifrons]|uniref:haloacid dehalogenase-like hydrolase domain-containing protein 3 n=1 Tax=Spea bombifrons TaxID=233779 RepID=UPI00234A059F|nr:haloacid dehalogenase-like hydrolase domain-containing protein 3 [Spea bombifrons]